MNASTNSSCRIYLQTIWPWWFIVAQGFEGLSAVCRSLAVLPANHCKNHPGCEINWTETRADGTRKIDLGLVLVTQTFMWRLYQHWESTTKAVEIVMPCLQLAVTQFHWQLQQQKGVCLVRWCVSTCATPPPALSSEKDGWMNYSTPPFSPSKPDSTTSLHILIR